MIPTSFLFVGLAMILLSCGNAATTNAPHRSQPAQSPTLYLLSSQGDLYAARADGKQLWQAPDGGNAGAIPPDGTHVIVAPQMIYVATDTVRAYTRDGQLRWRNDLPTMTEDSLLVGSTLYIAGGGTITAWDVTTGALR